MTKSRDLADNSQNTKPKVVDAKGDLIVGTGADAADRLAAGANGYTLVADSSTSTGLAYASSALAHPVINGAFDIWQRGTSIAGTASIQYTTDRWQMAANTASTVSRQNTGDTTNLPFIQYCARVQRTASSTSTTRQTILTSLETANCIPFAGRTITWSFYARAGANFSATSSLLGTGFYQGTGTDQNINSGYTGQTSNYGSFTLTTSWQRFTQTITLGATTTELAIQFYYDPPAGTAGANDYFEVTGVQIDLGSTALPFRRSGGTIQGEYAAAQRYYQRINAAQAYYRFSIGMNVSATQASFVVPFRVSMRTTPTFAASGNFESVEGTSNRGTNAPTLSTDGNNTESALLYTTIASATTGYAIQLRSANSTASYIEFSSEL